MKLLNTGYILILRIIIERFLLIICRINGNRVIFFIFGTRVKFLSINSLVVFEGCTVLDYNSCCRKIANIQMYIQMNEVYVKIIDCFYLISIMLLDNFIIIKWLTI